MNYEIVNLSSRTVHGNIQVLDQDPRFYLFLPKVWYMLTAERGDYLSPKPQIFGESTYQINGTSYAPYTVDFIANDNVSAGDYDILLIAYTNIRVNGIKIQRLLNCILTIGMKLNFGRPFCSQGRF